MIAERQRPAGRIDEWHRRREEWSRRYPDAPVRRALMRLPIVLWRLGLGPLVGRAAIRHGSLVLLTVTGRSTGLPRRTPVTAHAVGDRTYLWCPYGGRSQWYRNLVANPVATVQGRSTQVVRAVGIEDDEEAAEVVADLRRFDVPLLRLYLDREGISDTPEDIARNRQRLHIRRLDPTSEEGPPALGADLAWIWLVPVAVAVSSVRRRRRQARYADQSDRRSSSLDPAADPAASRAASAPLRDVAAGCGRRRRRTG